MVKTNRGTIADAFLSRDRKWKLFQTVVNPTTSIENLLTEFNGGPVEFKSRKVRVVSEYFRPSVFTKRFINGRHSEAAPSSCSNVLRIVEVYVNLQRSSLAMDAKFVVSSVNIRIWKSTYSRRQHGEEHIHGDLRQCGVLYAASQAAYKSRRVRQASGNRVDTWEDEVCKCLELAHDRSYTMEILAPMIGAANQIGSVFCCVSFRGMPRGTGLFARNAPATFPFA